MKKLAQTLATLTMIFTTVFATSGNAQALTDTQPARFADTSMPVQQLVVYEKQSVSYDNFGAAIFAQGQLSSEASKMPPGSEISFYIDGNKVNGPAGLQQSGVRCSSTQANADYYKNTITMEKRFCPDFNDAILDGRSVYGMVPTEAIFLHKSNGERCYATGNGGAVYLINPASAFVRNYIAKRGAEKLTQYGVNTLFLDNLQPSLSAVQERCGGTPQEYPNLNNYTAQMMDLASYVNSNMPNYRIQGNLANAVPSVWDQLSFLNGAMCESCFSNWGGSWPNASRMLSDLAVLDKWINVYGRTAFIVIRPPDTNEASNRFTFAASLLVARTDGTGVYFHFGANYGQLLSIPEYNYNLGLPTAPRTCNGNICTRPFQYGTVTVDFGTRQSTITLGSVPTLPAATSTATSTSTTVAPTATSGAASPTATSLVPPTATRTASPTALVPTATRTSSPTARPTFTNTAVVPTQVIPSPTTGVPGQNSLSVRVSSGSNDAEENSRGQMYTTSSDLELVYDSVLQTVGIRFTNVNLPKNANIVNAYIQFKVDKATSGTVNLKIQGQASPNPSAFTSTRYNISSRPRTVNFVNWSPSAWTKVGEAGPAQATPNLAPIIQEIIGQQNWASGNSLVIIITGNPAKRVAEAYEGDRSGAPLLYIEYNVPTMMIAGPTSTSTATSTATLPPPSATVTATATVEILPSETPSPQPSETPLPSDTPEPTPEVIVPTDTPEPTPTP